MKVCFRKLLAVTMVCMLLTVASGYAEETRSQEPDAIAMVADSVVARPLGLASVAIGFVAFAVSSPFSALGGNIGEAWDVLVVSPARFTFVRPLGHFDD